MFYIIFVIKTNKYDNKDLKLIETAKNMYWMDIKPEEADTDEAYNILEDLRIEAYHMEEAIYGMI